jgi:hypothetical protein
MQDREDERMLWVRDRSGVECGFAEPAIRRQKERMPNDRAEKWKAVEIAETRYRAFKERYAPVAALGGRVAEPMTEDATQELGRLGALCLDARRAWRDAARSGVNQPGGGS